MQKPNALGEKWSTNETKTSMKPSTILLLLLLAAATAAAYAAHEKLEYIHSTILEAIDGNVDLQMLNQALELTEDIREIYIEKE